MILFQSALWFCRQVKNCTLFAASYCWSPHLVYVMRQASPSLYLLSMSPVLWYFLLLFHTWFFISCSRGLLPKPVKLLQPSS